MNGTCRSISGMNGKPCSAERAALLLLCLAVGARGEASVALVAPFTAAGPGFAEFAGGSRCTVVAEFDSALLHLAFFAMGWAVFHWLSQRFIVYLPQGKYLPCALSAPSSEAPGSSRVRRQSLQEFQETSDCAHAGGKTSGPCVAVPLATLPEAESPGLRNLPGRSNQDEALAPSRVVEPCEFHSQEQPQAPIDSCSPGGRTAEPSPSISCPGSSGHPSPPSPSVASVVTSPSQRPPAVSTKGQLAAQVAEELLISGLESALDEDQRKGSQSAVAASQATILEKCVPPWRRTIFHDDGIDDDTCLSSYLSILRWHFECSTSCFVLAYVYMLRITTPSQRLEMNRFTIRRLLLTSLVLALKFHDDDYPPYSNAYYAKIGGLVAADFNQMERECCRRLNWSFFVSVEEFNATEALLYSKA